MDQQQNGRTIDEKIDALTITVQKGFIAADEKFDALALSVKKGFDAVDEKFDALALSVKEGFDAVDERFTGVDKRLDGIDTRLKKVEATMVTKNYLDDKLADLKGDLIVKLRKTNDKLDFVIALLRRHNLVSDDDLKQIRTEFQIFPSLS